jgi:hypothetical protein
MDVIASFYFERAKSYPVISTVVVIVMSLIVSKLSRVGIANHDFALKL